METQMKFTENLAAMAALSMALVLTACAESSHPSGHGIDHDADQHQSTPGSIASNAAATDTNEHEGHDMHESVAKTSTPETPTRETADVAVPAATPGTAVGASEPPATPSASIGTPAPTPAPKMAMTVKTSIADRETVTGSVSSIDLTFGHEMRLAGATLSTLTGDKIAVTFDSEMFAKQSNVTFETLESGDYTFTWRADAGDHEMSGSLRFTVER
jgi:methionine-rich copper-binding protein CopC